MSTAAAARSPSALRRKAPKPRAEIPPRGSAPSRHRHHVRHCLRPRRPQPSQTAASSEAVARRARFERERRRRLELARRKLEGFEPANRYQSKLQSTTLAMVRYMAEHWCGPDRVEDYDRWWLIVNRYARVLFSGTLQGPGTQARLKRLLDQNQKRPSDL